MDQAGFLILFTEPSTDKRNKKKRPTFAGRSFNNSIEKLRFLFVM